MTDLRKAAEMALEALEKLTDKRIFTADLAGYYSAATSSLRQALAQPEQEPVAYADPLDLAKDGNWDTFICKHASENHEGTRFKVPLFTAPPSKPENELDAIDRAYFAGKREGIDETVALIRSKNK